MFPPSRQSRACRRMLCGAAGGGSRSALAPRPPAREVLLQRPRRLVRGPDAAPCIRRRRARTRQPAALDSPTARNTPPGFDGEAISDKGVARIRIRVVSVPTSVSEADAGKNPTARQLQGPRARPVRLRRDRELDVECLLRDECGVGGPARRRGRSAKPHVIALELGPSDGPPCQPDLIPPSTTGTTALRCSFLPGTDRCNAAELLAALNMICTGAPRTGRSGTPWSM